MKLKIFSSCAPSNNRQLDSFKRSYSIQSKLGEGSFGEVFCVQCRSSKKKYAAKVVKNVKHQDKILQNDKLIPMEVWALKRLSGHPNIATFMEHHQIKDKIVIVTDYLSGYSDLFDHIEEHGRLTELSARNVIRQVVEVVGFCFKMGIDHRDIKEENIMYNPAGDQIKLIDFGSASVLSNRAYNFVRGTDIYIPPEHYLNSQYYPKPGAVWAIGCLAFCCLSSFTPFTSLNQIVSTGPDWSLLAHCSTDSLDFVKCSLNISEKKRMPFHMMRHHVWVVDSIEEFSNLELECSL
ncbi:hypothetical protein ACHWQZ_G007951 [Mnemiopsis leidyi]